MEKISPTSIDLYLPYVKLYLNDIEEIILILKKINPSEIQLESNNSQFEFNEIESLKFDKINKLKITAKLPVKNDFTISSILNDFSIIFDSSGSHISCWTNSLEIQGLVKELEVFIISKKRLLGQRFLLPLTYALLVVSGIIFISFLPFLILGLLGKENPFYPINYIINLVFLLFLFSLRFYKNIIYLKQKKDLPNFFIRNKDQLIIDILLLLIGYLIGKYL